MRKTSDFILSTMFNKRDGEYKLGGFWYSLFRPVGNRYYVGMRLYTISFMIQYIPVTLLLVYLVINSDAKLPCILALAAWLTAAMFDLFVIRRYEEKVTWKYLYSKHYGNDSNSETQRINFMMNEIEKNPTPENEAALRNELKDDNKN